MFKIILVRVWNPGTAFTTEPKPTAALVLIIAITGMTHKTSYFHIFVVATVIPVLATIVGIVLASLGIA